MGFEERKPLSKGLIDYLSRNSDADILEHDPRYPIIRELMMDGRIMAEGHEGPTIGLAKICIRDLPQKPGKIIHIDLVTFGNYTLNLVHTAWLDNADTESLARTRRVIDRTLQDGYGFFLSRFNVRSKLTGAYRLKGDRGKIRVYNVPPQEMMLRAI